mgnify:FL=1
MPLHIIVGAQWGDEGKGRIVDYLASSADYVARFNGGDNAGHTVTIGSHIFKLHLVPSGIIHPQTIAILGNGMVVNPRSLLDEIDILRQAGVEVTPQRLHLSFGAHLITPAHQALDAALETARGKGKLGTTGRGIGPAYTDKAARRGLRLGDMLREDFLTRLGEHILESNLTLGLLGAPELDPSPILDSFRQYVEQLRPYIADTSAELHNALSAGKTVLAEGAQGSLLDIEHGTYPYVTSSSTVAPGALTGLGLGLQAAHGARIIGVAKSFQTRVGAGPFPTEVFGPVAERLRGTGANPWDEFGTTTGRPRRVGWIDTVLLRYAVRLNGLTELVLTKLDILTGLEKLYLCTAYRVCGEIVDTPPFGCDLQACEPIYEELPGWQMDVHAARRWDDLPLEARAYVRRIEEITGVPVKHVSVGPEREQIAGKNNG